MVVGVLALSSRPAAAAPLIPGPDDAGHDAALAAKMGRFERQIHGVMTVPLGWGLQAVVSDPDARTQIEGFVASDAATFEAFSGQHVYALIDDYGEMGDLGMFGGVQAAATPSAMPCCGTRAPTRRTSTRRGGAARDDGRAALADAVTGAPGVVARGIARIPAEAGEPPVPGDRRPRPCRSSTERRPAARGQGADMARRRVGRAALPRVARRLLARTSSTATSSRSARCTTRWSTTRHDPRRTVDRLVEDARAIGSRADGAAGRERGRRRVDS